jgi:hypothetical protein
MFYHHSIFSHPQVVHNQADAEVEQLAHACRVQLVAPWPSKLHFLHALR